MKKPKTVLIKVSLLRKTVRLIKKQQTTLHEQQHLIEKLLSAKRRKRRARNTQPMNAGIGTYGIQMGN
jgi:hypothetical protein